METTVTDPTTRPMPKLDADMTDDEINDLANFLADHINKANHEIYNRFSPNSGDEKQHNFNIAFTQAGVTGLHSIARNMSTPEGLMELKVQLAQRLLLSRYDTTGTRTPDGQFVPAEVANVKH